MTLKIREKCRFFTVLLAILAFAAFTATTFAQNANSSIQGTVEDTHGAVVPGATVDLTNVGTNQELHTKSNGSGFFTFTNLAPADYKVTATAPGFAEWEGTLTLRVSQAASVSPTLTAAAVSTHVTVRNVTPVIDRVNPTLSDVKSATTIEAMPVGGRNILSVLAFSPGVVANNYGRAGGGFTRVNGVPGGSVNYVVDGQTANNAFSGALEQHPPSTMTFQEAKVLASNGDAQYGTPGVVQLVTKSGTNQFHGQIFELNQNQHLQARGFKSGPTIPFLQHNEYGFQVGGPVIRNHTFFFFDMEWLKTQQNVSVQYTVPTQDQRTGNLSDLKDQNGNAVTIYDPNTTTLAGNGVYTRTPFPGNIIPTNRLNPVTQKILGVTPVAGLDPLPLPNISGTEYWINGNFNLEPPSLKQTDNQKQITAKVDQLFGASRLAARYTYVQDKQRGTYAYYNPTAPNQSDDGGHNGSISLTSVLGPTKVNVFHFGVQYNTHFSGPKPIPGIPAKLGLPDYPGSITWPSFYFDSYNGTDSYWTGIDRNNPKAYPNQVVSADDQFSWNPGNHQFLFGFGVNNNRITTSEIGQPGGGYGYNGLFTAQQDASAVIDNGDYGTGQLDTGSGLADFLLGDSQYLFLNVYPIYHTRQTEYYGYVQDDWRASQKLTLNLGLRYQYWTAWVDSSGRLSTFIPTVPGGMVAYMGKGPLPAYTSQALYDNFVAAGLPIESAVAAGLPANIYTMPKYNFEPRLGFAYQLDSKTVLRGGWGIYQWVIPLNFFQQAQRKNPPFSYSLSTGPGVLPSGVGTNTAAAELEFPIATANFAGPQPINQFMLGNQDCTNQPAGTCNPPGLAVNPSASKIQGGGFGMVGMNPNVKPQTVQEYNLTFGRELPWNTGFQLSYIGNHYYNQMQYDPINYTIPRDNCAEDNSPNIPECQSGTARYRRPYANFSTSNADNYNYINWNGYGNTNELQAQLTHTVGGNLILQAYFTWLKALSTISGEKAYGIGKLSIPLSTAIPAALTPGYDLNNPTTSGAALSQRVAPLYSNDPNLPAKMFKFNINYTLPFGRGQRFLGDAHGLLNALVSGYNIAPFFTWHSGLFFAPYATALKGGEGPQGRLVSLAPGKTGVLPKSDRNADRWFDASIWDPNATSGPTSGPYNGQTYEYSTTSNEGDFRNNIPFNYMTGPGFNEMDLGLYKVTPIWRNLKLDFAAQFFNVYNHINWALPSNKGIISGQVGQSRTIQLQAKIVF